MTLSNDARENLQQLILHAARLKKKADELQKQSEELHCKAEKTRKRIAALKNRKRGL